MRNLTTFAYVTGIMMAALQAQATDRFISDSRQIRQNHETRMGAAKALASLPHVAMEWLIAPLFGLKPELDRWMIAQELQLRQLLHDTGMPGILISMRREALHYDSGTKTRLIGGEPLLIGPGLDPKSTALAYSRAPAIQRSEGANHYDEASSEYLWVQEKNGEIRWSNWPAVDLHNEVRLSEADDLLIKTFDRSYDIEAAGRVVDRLAINDNDEALRREAKILSDARMKALEDAEHINAELAQALERNRKANNAARVFEMIGTAASLAGSVADLVRQFPDRKIDLERAGAVGSKQPVIDVLNDIKDSAADDARRAQQKKTENTVQQHEIRRKQQPLLDRRKIPSKVPGIGWKAPRELDPGNGVPVGPPK